MMPEEERVLRAAMEVAQEFRLLADRLIAYADAADFVRLSEIQMSMRNWTLDAVRGAAWVIQRGKDDK